MNHDPICPSKTYEVPAAEDCLSCELIAKGRAAERSNFSTAWWSQEWHAGYRQGYDDAKAKNER